MADTAAYMPQGEGERWLRANYDYAQALRNKFMKQLGYSEEDLLNDPRKAGEIKAMLSQEQRRRNAAMQSGFESKMRGRNWMEQRTR